MNAPSPPQATGLRQPCGVPGCDAWGVQRVNCDGRFAGEFQAVMLPPSAEINDLMSMAWGKLGLRQGDRSSLAVTTTPCWVSSMKHAPLPWATQLGDISPVADGVAERCDALAAQSGLASTDFRVFSDRQGEGPYLFLFVHVLRPPEVKTSPRLRQMPALPPPAIP